MQIEPNPYLTDSITVTLSNGKSLTQAIGGQSGAQFFGFVGSGITSLTITDSSGHDFAFGNFYSTVGASAVKVNSADLVSNTTSVTLTGASGTSGVLTVNVMGQANTYSVTANNGMAVGPGTYTVPFVRPSMAIDTYSSVQASWAIQPSSSSDTFVLPDRWEVRGTVRHSQYNVPAENACTGSKTPAYIIAEDCTSMPISLASDFMAQTQLNGTGMSISYGLLKPLAITTIGNNCRRDLPVDVADAAFVTVSSVTGSCNQTLTAGGAVATYPNPKKASVPSAVCGDATLLVTSSNVNQAVKTTLDSCPACASDFRGTNGHIDNFATNNACSAHSATDLGNFWTADTRGQKQ